MNIKSIKWQKEDMEGYYTTRAFDWKFSVYESNNGKWSWTQSSPGLCFDCEIAEYETLEEAKKACEEKIRKMIDDFEKYHLDY